MLAMTRIFYEEILFKKALITNFANLD